MIRPIAVSRPMSGLATDALFLSLAVLIAHGPWLFADVYSPQLDYLLHYLWAMQFTDALSQGVWQPGWVPASRGGLGDPVFVYYMPLFYYLTAAADWLTGDMWLAIKVVCTSSALLTGLVVSGFARTRGLGAAWARGLGALAILLPLLLVVRGTINAYPWFVAHLFLSLALVALLRCLEAPGRGRIAALALAVAALGWMHTLVSATFLLTATIGLLADWAILDRSRDGFRRGLAVAASFTLGLALAAPALLPAVATLGLVTPSGWKHKNPDFPTWFNTFSFPTFTQMDRVHFAWLMPWGTFLLLPVFVLLVVRLRPLSPATRAMVWIVATSCVLSTELSYPLWSRIEALQIFQRPFRFLSPMTFAMLIGAVPLLVELRFARASRRLGRRATAVLAVVALVAILPLPILIADNIHDQILHPERGTKITPASIDAFFAVPEHLPSTSGPGWRAYLDAGGFDAECAAHGARCTGRAQIAHRFNWRIDAIRATTLRLPLMGYPTWIVTVDGVDLGTPIDPATGLLQIDVRPGVHLVTARWRALPTQVVGNQIGASALVIVLGLWAGWPLRPSQRGGGRARLTQPGPS